MSGASAVLMIALLLVPWIGALTVVGGSRRLAQDTASRIAVGASAVTAVAALWLVALTPRGTARMTVFVDLPWIPALGVRLRFGLDGVSAPLVLLTVLLAVLVCLHLARVPPASGSPAGLAGCVLAVLGASVATFTALDLLVFFIAFEAVLVPMWFVIARWGDDTVPAATAPPHLPQPGGERARREAANRFIVFTVTGSGLMLLGLLLIAARSGTTDLVLLAQRRGEGLGATEQVVAGVLLAAGLAVKAPMFPLHTWLPPAHSIAPTAGSVLLAGVLLKLGSYGLVRLVVPVVPDGLRTLAPVLASCAAFGIVWAGLACAAQTDLKRLIALSSVSHMGFVLLGIVTMTPVGLQGALFGNIAHGLISALLFLVVGALKDRHHTTALAALPRGLRDRSPRLGWLLAFACVAGLGVPGLAGFWGEVLPIAGAWQQDSAAGPVSRVCAVLAVLGTLLAAAYFLRVLRQVWHGQAEATTTPESTHPAPGGTTSGHEGAPPLEDDLRGVELAVSAPLVGAVVLLGLAPWLLLDLTAPVVRALLGVAG